MTSFVKKDVDLSTIRCQKCLQFGHWTYQCTNERKSLIRPSRTAQMKQRMRRMEKGLPPVPLKKKPLSINNEQSQVGAKNYDSQSLEPSKNRASETSDDSDSEKASSSSSSSNSSSSSDSSDSESSSDSDSSDSSSSAASSSSSSASSSSASPAHKSKKRKA